MNFPTLAEKADWLLRHTQHFIADTRIAAQNSKDVFTSGKLGDMEGDLAKVQEVLQRVLQKALDVQD